MTEHSGGTCNLENDEIIAKRCSAPSCKPAIFGCYGSHNALKATSHQSTVGIELLGVVLTQVTQGRKK